MDYKILQYFLTLIWSTSDLLNGHIFGQNLNPQKLFCMIATVYVAN